MKAVRYFEDFLREGVVKKQAPAKSRAEFLIGESEKEHNALIENLSVLGINQNNLSTYFKMCYDIIMELLRARLLLDGFNASGNYAHEAEVAYMRNLEFKEQDVQFLDQMRYFRNGLLYYGTILDTEYVKQVIGFINKVRRVLLRKLR